jgi:hypothetical protein
MKKKGYKNFCDKFTGGCPNPLITNRANEGRTTGGKHDSELLATSIFSLRLQFIN